MYAQQHQQRQEGETDWHCCQFVSLHIVRLLLLSSVVLHLSTQSISVTTLVTALISTLCSCPTSNHLSQPHCSLASHLCHLPACHLI